MSHARAILPYANDDDRAPVSDAGGHRRRTARHVRHEAKARLRPGLWDEEVLEDAVCPEEIHDLGRKGSPKPKDGPKPGRRDGFKVWKTPFWKRRRALWAQRNATERQLLDED